MAQLPLEQRHRPPKAVDGPRIVTQLVGEHAHITMRCGLEGPIASGCGEREGTLRQRESTLIGSSQPASVRQTR
jgi:hypothetical protein